MANNLYKVTTREQAIESFKEHILPAVIEKFEWNGFDEIARSQAWSDYTDSLREDKQISDWQYENWNHPDICDNPNKTNYLG